MVSFYFLVFILQRIVGIWYNYKKNSKIFKKHKTTVGGYSPLWTESKNIRLKGVEKL